MIKFGIQLEPGSFADIIGQALLCEKSGFDSVWYPDHFVGGAADSLWPEAICAMTAAALNTSRILIGSGTTDVLRRHPALLAQSMATLDHLSDGRAILGLGAGEAMNLAPFGIPQRHACSKLREAIIVMRNLWAAGATHPARYEGEFYHLHDAYLQIAAKSRLPVYVGAFAPKMLALTGELADGWIPFSHTPETYRDTLNGPIKEAAERFGRRLSDIEPALIPAASISTNREEAKRSILAIARTLLVLVPDILRKCLPGFSHAGTVSLHQWMGRLDQQANRIMRQISSEIPEDVALRTVIWGNTDDCIEQVDDFINAGCRHMIFGIRGPNRDQAIKQFGQEVLPYFRELGK